MNPSINPVEKLDSRSTIYQKLTPDQRRMLNRAIVDRSQPTYRACYEHFRLADCNIGFSAFYRYARDLRHLATITDLAESRGSENTDPITLNEAVTQLLAYRLIEAGDDETADSHELLRLMRAYNLSARTQKTLHDNDDRAADKCRDRRKQEAEQLVQNPRSCENPFSHPSEQESNHAPPNKRQPAETVPNPTQPPLACRAHAPLRWECRSREIRENSIPSPNRGAGWGTRAFPGPKDRSVLIDQEREDYPVGTGLDG